jgi:type IV secretory pathway VirB4 component
VAIDQSAIADDDQLLAMVMTCASAWMEAALSDPRGGHRWVIYDEGWRLLKEPTMLARMQSEWKLARKFGVANLLIVHRLSDLDAIGDAGSQARGLATGLLSDISTRIIYQQETNEAPHAGKLLGLSVTEQAELSNLQRGEGLWRVGQRAFVVRHLATQGELDLYATHGRMEISPTATQNSES